MQATMMNNTDQKPDSTTVDIIRSELEKEYIKVAVDKLIQEAVSEAGEDVSVEGVVARMMGSDVVQTLLTRLHISKDKETSKTQPVTSTLLQKIKGQLEEGHRYLYINVIAGRAFIDYLETENKTQPPRTLQLRMALVNQRLDSEAVECVYEPQFNEVFMFDLQALKQGDGSGMVDGNELLYRGIPVNVAAVRRSHTGLGCLISAYLFEWRRLLSEDESYSKFVWQLMGVGSDHQIPAGLVDVEACLLPPLDTPLPAHVVTDHIEKERKEHGERRRMFLSFAREWWREYLEGVSLNRGQLGSLFAMDQHGCNRFLCEFVRCVDVGRGLKSPEEAARWVSLLPTLSAHHHTPGNSAPYPWYSLPISLLAPALSLQNKCCLLCGVLLGFGLDAWVVTGSRVIKQGDVTNEVFHTWVLTKGPYSAITFWDVSTGGRHLHKLGKKSSHGYVRVSSLFNHRHFYVNCQVSDKTEYCSFSLDDPGAWREMSSSTISSLTEGVTGHEKLLPPLKLPALNGNQQSIQLEAAIKVLIAEHRGDCGLSTNFDSRLAQVLTPALWSFEADVIRGLGGEKRHELFSAALMHTIPEGHTFKALPLHVTHSSPSRLLSAILSSSVGSAVVGCRGHNVKLAVRVITACYPQEVSATWIMVACSYLPPS